MLAKYPHKQSLYKWALPCFPQCLLRSKIPLSISAPRPFSASVPLPCDRRAPQTATGRRRAPQTATGRRRAPQTATGRRRAPQTATGRRRAPQTATGRRRAPQTATGRRRAPQTATGRRRAPQTATGRRRAPQTATGRRRAPQTATGRRRAPQTAPGRQDARTPESAPIHRTRRAPLFSARSNLSSWTRLEGLEPPPKPPFFLSNPSRACARSRARARIMRPRARFWPLDWSHGA